MTVSSGPPGADAVLVQVIDVWEPVTESDVQTPLEVYKELQEDGYDVVSCALSLLGAVHAIVAQGPLW